MMFLAGVGALTACQDLDELRTYAPESVVSPVMGTLPSQMVITPDDFEDVLKFTWAHADFGVDTQVNYSVEASLGGVEDALSLVTGVAQNSTELNYETINGRLALPVEDGGLGVPVDTPTEVKFYVSATIGLNFAKYYSSPVAVTVTTTAAERTYPMLRVVGDYCGWSHGDAQKLFSFSGDEVTYEGMVDFGEKAANGWKISAGQTDWTDSGNYGLDGSAAAPVAEAASMQLINSGGSSDIKAYSHRFYRIKFNTTTMVVTKDVTMDRLGVIGSATPTGWDGDTAMEFDAATQRFWVDLTLVDGEIKFRADNTWGDFEWGGADGALALKGSNIAVSAGDYRIYVNLNDSANMTYEISEDDYGTEIGGGVTPPQPERADWYLHGQTIATPDWDETAMTGGGTDAYKLLATEVAAGSGFLFKTGDGSTWMGPAASYSQSPYAVTIGQAFEVSTDKVDGLIEAAGTYDYWLLPKQGVAYVITAGEKPGVVADAWGIVGNLTDWGAIGDFAMVAEGNYFVRKGIYIGANYEFKIRRGNDWNGTDVGSESGPVDVDAGFATGGSNITIGADGVYDIYFDETAGMIWIMTAGSTPSR